VFFVSTVVSMEINRRHYFRSGLRKYEKEFLEINLNVILSPHKHLLIKKYLHFFTMI